jgi:L-ascorbate metabolism protein UlaG (beta-lactamase superfamily)
MNDNKTIVISSVALVLALISLTIGGMLYLQQPTKTEIKLSAEKPIVQEQLAYSEDEKNDAPVYTGTSNGFVIKFENGTVLYLSGDTALFGDMKWVIHDYYKPDIALLSAGNVFTMDPIDAALATTWIDPKYVAPYHYKIFPFLEQSPDRFVNLVKEYQENGQTRAEGVPLVAGEEQELEGIKITWLGHGGFYFISPTGLKIVVDPWFTPNPGTPAEFKDMNVFGNVDLLLITHGHLDHFDIGDMEKLVSLYDPVIFSQWEVMGYLQPKIPGKYLMMNKGGRITKDVLEKQGIEDVVMPEEMEITLVHADHSSSAP